MAVYVDQLVDYGWRHGESCHLIADTVTELKQFAVEMGLRVEWYQPRSSPHFDLTVNARELAVRHGAIDLDRRAFVAKMRELRARGWPERDTRLRHSVPEVKKNTEKAVRFSLCIIPKTLRLLI